MQGPSIAFDSCNFQLMAKAPGGSVYSTVYPADFMQNSGPGTTDVSFSSFLPFRAARANSDQVVELFSMISSSFLFFFLSLSLFISYL